MDLFIYFLIFPFRARLHNGAEAQMFAHPNNEGIWEKEKVLLSVRMEGHQLPDKKNTHKGCRIHTGRHATVDTNTHRQVNKHAHTHKYTQTLKTRQTHHKNTISLPFCLLAHTNTHATDRCKLPVL